MNGPVNPTIVRQQQAAIDAAGAAHIVRVSVPDASPHATLSMGRWHGQIDAHLTASGLGWSLLRPSYFMQNVLDTCHRKEP